MSFSERWKSFPLIVTERLVLRELRPADAAEYHAYDCSNAASARALIKAGFAEEGILRDFGWNHARKEFRNLRMFSILNKECAQTAVGTPAWELRWQQLRAQPS
jgi:RimJ/RimL family protein N-acetyltransferase